MRPILPVLLAMTAAAAEPSRPGTFAFQRRPEPREGAFTLLVPSGWRLEGGIVRVDPNQAGGTLNATEAKCDLAVSADKAGTVQLRRLPKVVYAVPGISPFHGPGTVYNGAQVVALPRVGDYLAQGLPRLRPQAQDLRILDNRELPELAAAVQAMCQPLNQALAQAGMPAWTVSAGYILAEYQEGGRGFKELGWTILVDTHLGLWANDLTTAMRCPAGEEARWKPVLDIIANSVRLDPRWIAREARSQQQNAAVAQRLQQDLARLDQDIAGHRRATQEGIQREQFLTLMGKEDWRNPFTGEVERDTSAWGRRWINEAGDLVYTDDPAYDPNADAALQRQGFRLTAPAKR